jgi:hypothetical protein
MQDVKNIAFGDCVEFEGKKYKVMGFSVREHDGVNLVELANENNLELREDWLFVPRDSVVVVEADDVPSLDACAWAEVAPPEEVPTSDVTNIGCEETCTEVVPEEVTDNVPEVPELAPEEEAL